MQAVSAQSGLESASHPDDEHRGDVLECHRGAVDPAPLAGAFTIEYSPDTW